VLNGLQTRRFFCGNYVCAKTTYAEQTAALMTRCGRRNCSLQKVAPVLGGRAASR
jgi:hypothetical protein